MKNIFTEHPNSVGETYWVHFKFASCMGINLMMASIVCTLHAIFPFLFKKTGSSIMIKLMHRLIARKPSVGEDVAGLVTAIEHKNSHQQ
jgi:hypothetical protein